MNAMQPLRRLTLLLSLLMSVGIAPAAEKVVAITQIVEHPALDSVRQGVIDELDQMGFIVGKNLRIVYENAQGNVANTVAIANKFVGINPDVIVTIATPSAQAVSAQNKKIPHVFAAVTDPVGAELVKDPNNPKENTTGVSDLAPMDLHMGLIKTLVPNVRRVGFIYNPGEANSKTLLRLAKTFASEQGIEIVESTANRSSEVLAATNSLVGKVDAIYIPTDNTVVSALEAVVKVGIDRKIPIIAGDTASVERGAVAAVGFDYYDVGRQAGAMVADILNGAKPGDIPVQFVQRIALHLNLSAAKDMGVVIPPVLRAVAEEVLE